MQWWNYFFAGANAPGGPGFVTTLAPLESAWTAYTPTVNATTGALGAHSATGRYLLVGKTCFIGIEIVITANGTGAGSLSLNLPVAAFSTETVSLNGREVAVSGKAVTSDNTSAGGLRVVNYDNTYPGATGASIILNGVYQTA